MSAFDNTKRAFVWVHAIHPYCVGYPGVTAELFFSSREKFNEAFGFADHPERETLVEVTVPKDFEDWDYIPRDY